MKKERIKISFIRIDETLFVISENFNKKSKLHNKIEELIKNEVKNGKGEIKTNEK